MPGFTHLQTAQLVTFGHHLLAWFEMLSRDYERLVDCRKRTNRMPLGSAALAGTTYPIQREITCELLGFEAISGNSLDGVSDRDFAIEFCAAASRGDDAPIALLRRAGALDQRPVPVHRPAGSLLHRLLHHAAEEEPGRARAGTRQDRPRVRRADRSPRADEGPAAGVQQGQPGRQGTLFDAADTLRDSLRAFADMVPAIKPKREIMREAALRGFSTATDLADYLVRKGPPFRDCHEIVGHAVKYGVQTGKDLAEMTLDELRQFSGEIGDDVFAVLTLEGSVNARDHIGGTAPAQVRAAVKRGQALLAGR